MILFPFTAIVGMEQAKKSLIYHAINPRIGGTLLLGHRGCAKSTLVRAFSEILASTATGPAPFVEVPLGTSEDRLLGSVNAEMLVEQSKWRERAGLLELANGGVLYIDEINLLPDHLSDYILDSAASGRYRMERDGITRIVESRYILVGTMNPEEGDLRPQLSDRFAHGVQVQDAFGAEERMEIVHRRIQFDNDPEGFVDEYAAATTELKNRIKRAQAKLKEVSISRENRMAVAEKGRLLNLEGIRAELAVVRTALCAAAWEDRSEVEPRDLEEAWNLCLGHRQIAPPAPPQTTPPPPQQRPSRPEQQTPGSTSQAPLDSKADSKALSALKPLAHDRLHSWWNKPSEPKQPEREKSIGYSDRPGTPIAWVETVVAAARTGWKPGDKLAAFRYHRPDQRKHLWCFLDASRSTGATRFLGSARDAVAGLARKAKSARFHLLILQGGEIKWAVRRASFRRFESALNALAEASGKSLLLESLKSLHRARLKYGTSCGNRLLIASDGLASPTPGEKSDQTLRRMRSRLQQLVRSGTPLAWVYPRAKRGLSRWLPSVFRGFSIERIELEAGRL